MFVIILSPVSFIKKSKDEDSRSAPKTFAIYSVSYLPTLIDAMRHYNEMGDRARDIVIDLIRLIQAEASFENIIFSCFVFQLHANTFCEG